MGHVGAPFEWTVGNYFRRQGYTVIRAYKSLGIWDLMCFKKMDMALSYTIVDGKGNTSNTLTLTEALAVQVKGKTSDPFTDEEKATLKQWAEGFGGRAVYAYGKRMPLKKKIPGSRQRLQKNRTVVVEYL